MSVNVLKPLVSFITAGVLSIACFTAAQAKTVLKMGHVVAPTNAGHIAMEFASKELEKRTNGRVTIQIFPSAQLGSERELVESIQLGNLDMTFVSSAVLGVFNKEFFALDIPFMFKDRESVYKLLDGKIGQKLLTSLDNVGIKGLVWWENGFRQLHNNKHPIKKPADMKGMKLRTMENEIHIAAWKAVGASPAPLAFGELFTALQQGTFDGAEGPISLFKDMRFDEVQKYITRTNHIYSPWPVLINPDVYNSLGQEDQKILLDVMQEATHYQRDLAQKADEKAIAAMPDVTVTDLTNEEYKAFSDLMQPIQKMVKEKVGGQIVDEILAELNANK